MNRFFMKPMLLAAALLLTVPAARASMFSYNGLEYYTLDETTCEVGTIDIVQEQ